MNKSFYLNIRDMNGTKVEKTILKLKLHILFNLQTQFLFEI